ncbi:MAG: 4a-hydroxytetrahydrobiopterin dehydratase [Candidatus Promineofilum sp.]|nr:4a-hydroxytetrahydrobiopterin dehydratase [Promineifilum sp.]MBP9657226.1 4a-hydroxytetrahydrobiopterin dehydratase [Promineifilum sp.]
MARNKLTQEQIQTALDELPGWEVKEGKLHKTFKFETFAQAIGWMVSVAIHADKMDHHPDWANAYNRVMVDLSTHDMDDAISSFDVNLARQMEKLAGQG